MTILSAQGMPFLARDYSFLFWAAAERLCAETSRSVQAEVTVFQQRSYTMACPVTLGGGAFILITGLYSVFFQDRRYRRIWWTALFLIGAGWFSYYRLERPPALRITLEVLSVLLFVVVQLRLLRLVLVEGLRPPGSLLLSKLANASRPYTLNAGTIAIKSFILSMIIFEWLGKASFSAEWYLWSLAVLGAWVLTLLAFRKWLAMRLVTAVRSNRVLMKYFSKESSKGCPLGYGK